MIDRESPACEQMMFCLIVKHVETDEGGTLEISGLEREIELAIYNFNNQKEMRILRYQSNAG